MRVHASTCKYIHAPETDCDAARIKGFVGKVQSSLIIDQDQEPIEHFQIYALALFASRMRISRSLTYTYRIRLWVACKHGASTEKITQLLEAICVSGDALMQMCMTPTY